MNPAHFLAMVFAETRKTFTRGSAMAALAIAALVGILTVGVLWKVSTMGEGAQINGANVADLVKTSAVQAAGWALWARNFFVLPLFILLATASSVAGEHGDRTLRELIVRPVPRWSVLAAKLLALSALSAATLVLTLVPSLGLGFAAFGNPVAPQASADTPTILALLGGYAASFLSDLGLVAVTMLVSLLVSSVGGVVVAVALLLMADAGLRGALWVLGKVGVQQAETLIPWTFGNALGAWEGWSQGWAWPQFAALGVFIAGSLAACALRFQRMDVP